MGTTRNTTSRVVGCGIHRPQMVTLPWNASYAITNSDVNPNRDVALPYKIPGATNCLLSEWPALLHDVINNLMQSSSSSNVQQQDPASNRTHLAEEDDCTTYTHILPLEYDCVEGQLSPVLQDFGKAVQDVINSNMQKPYSQKHLLAITPVPSKRKQNQGGASAGRGNPQMIHLEEEQK